jgi:hypothetical protein
LGQAERFFVALSMSEDLFTCAKDLLIEATAPTGLRDVGSNAVTAKEMLGLLLAAVNSAAAASASARVL